MEKPPRTPHPKATKVGSRADLALLPATTPRVTSHATREIGGRDTAQTGQRRDPKAWQDEAYTLTEEIGEANFVLSVKANTLATGRLVIDELDEHGVIVDLEDSQLPKIREKADRVLRALGGADGTHDDLLTSFCYHDEIAGEAQFFGEIVQKDGKDQQVAWELLSVFEIEESKSGKSRKIDADLAATAIVEGYSGRYIRRGLRHSGSPTSTIKTVLPILREIAGLTQIIDATVNSRLPAGLVLLANELDVPRPVDEDVDQDAEGDEDWKSIEDIIADHMAAAVTNRASTASLVPVFVRVPALAMQAGGDLVKHYSWGNEVSSTAAEMRDKAVARLALGLDAPPETLTGLGSTNHWNGWVIEQSFILKHILPAGRRFAKFLTEKYLHYVLEHFEDVKDAKEFGRFRIRYDASALLNSEDEGETARALHAEGLVSAATAIRKSGHDPDTDGMGDEERVTQALWNFALKDPAGAVAAGVWAKLGVDLDPVEPAASSPVADSAPAPVSKSKGRAGASSTGGPGQNAIASTSFLLGLADSAVSRGVERAASKVVTAAGKAKDEEVLARIRGRSKMDILSLVTADELSRMNLTAEFLFDGAFRDFGTQAQATIRENLVAEGVDRRTADETASRSASRLLIDLDRLAATALDRPLPQTSPAGAIVPLSLVSDVMWEAVQ